jgi:hypothetical protein
VPALREALLQLQAAGCRVLTTSCGFLVLLQQELQAALAVPLVTSSLLLLPDLLAREERVGVLTIAGSALGHEHLHAAGVPQQRLADVLVQGVAPAGEFATAILGDRDRMDFARAGDDVVAAAHALRLREPRLRFVVLECTNMPPYARRVEAETGMVCLSLWDSPVLAAALGGALAPDTLRGFAKVPAQNPGNAGPA